MGRDQRRLRNWVIAPIIQLRIVSHIIVVTAISLLSVLAYTYWAWGDIVSLLIEMTDIPGQVKQFLMDRFSLFFVVLAAILFLQFALVSVLLIVHTHRFVGASYAIRRFIKEKLKNKDYTGAVILRKNDYLSEISIELNELSESLLKEEKK